MGKDLKGAVNMLANAYRYDNTHPMVLNHLANHFFYQGDYEKTIQLARLACALTHNDAVKAESFFSIARAFHAQVRPPPPPPPAHTGLRAQGSISPQDCVPECLGFCLMILRTHCLSAIFKHSDLRLRARPVPSLDMAEMWLD